MLTMRYLVHAGEDEGVSQTHFLDSAWAEATIPRGGPMLTVLGGLGQFERDLIRARFSEGRGRVNARRVKVGRNPKLTPHQRREAIKRRERGDEALEEIGRSYGVSARTILRLRPPWE